MRFYRNVAFWLRNYYRFLFLGDRFVLDIRRWFADNGDKTLRLEYALKNESIVFDIGGYEGEWAKTISDTFSCSIYIFEPVPEFAVAIKARFAENARINVYPYGLSNENGDLLISLRGDGSSFYASTAGESAKASVRRFDFALLEELGVSHIDLMKINIEGGEYDLIDFMIENKTIGLVNNIQIQFHNFVPHAIKRRNDIRRRLELTHSETWCYDFVWESWRRKNVEA
ncbi:MAG: FkbM family methyltransferase [Burkholderiales bacterium]